MSRSRGISKEEMARLKASQSTVYLPTSSTRCICNGHNNMICKASNHNCSCIQVPQKCLAGVHICVCNYDRNILCKVCHKDLNIPSLKK